MIMNEDIKKLDINISMFLKDIVSSMTSVDWLQDEFNRNEVTLKDGRLCLLPYLISRPEQLVPSNNRNNLLKSIHPLIEFILDKISGHKIIRGELVNLLPGVSLVPHIDGYWFHKASRRIHIPITTNSNSMLTFDDRPYHLESGKVYEINNRIMHSGFNFGNTDRIHLILDMMPIDVFKNALHTKQNFMEVV